MPSVSKKQHNLMLAVAHSPKFAKKVGIPQSVGKDFSEADKGRKFGIGGSANISHGGKGQINKQITRAGSIYGQQKEVPNVSLNKYIGKKEGGMAKSDMKEDMKADIKQDKAIIKKAFGMHDKQLHESKKTDLSKLKKGGMAMKKMAMGGATKYDKTPKPSSMAKDLEAGSGKKIAFGESAVQKRGHTKGMEERNYKTLGIQSGAKGGSNKTVNAAPIKMAKGGSASARADGCAVKGKTKGTMMCMGGKAGKK